MNGLTIDINCDVGEGIGNEALLFPYISSCNIACGGHAGDIATIKQILGLSAKYNIRAGAHPSYPDKLHFGRVSLQIPEYTLIDSIREQLRLFTDTAGDHGMPLHHIKAHGALYNDIARDRGLARIFLDAILIYKTDTPLYVPFNSVIAEEATRQGFQIILEAFGDRSYNTDGSLVSRQLPGAVLTEPEKALRQIVSIVRDKKVLTIAGTKSEMVAQTICIHGDTPSALQILMYLHSELPRHNISIKK